MRRVGKRLGCGECRFTVAAIIGRHNKMLAEMIHAMHKGVHHHGTKTIYGPEDTKKREGLGD